MSDMDDIVKALALELPLGSSAPPLPRKTRKALARVIAKYKAQIDLEGEDDKRYFIENPSRNHRVRYAFPNEEQQLREISELNPYCTKLPKNARVVVLVKQVMPGVRMKKPALITSRVFPTADDLIMASEEEAKGLYGRWRPNPRIL